MYPAIRGNSAALNQDKTDWQTIAQRWGRLEYLHPTEIMDSDSYWQLDHEIGQRFHDYICREYDHLFSITRQGRLP